MMKSLAMNQVSVLWTSYKNFSAAVHAQRHVQSHMHMSTQQ